jgi:hypothetical protein
VTRAVIIRYCLAGVSRCSNGSRIVHAQTIATNAIAEQNHSEELRRRCRSVCGIPFRISVRTGCTVYRSAATNVASYEKVIVFVLTRSEETVPLSVPGSPSRCLKS